MGETQVKQRLCKCGCGQIAKRHYASDGQFKSWRSYASGHAPNETRILKIPKSKTDLAYMAGVVDGEGCIYAKQNGAHGTFVCLQIQMCSDAVIKWVASTFGGSVYTQPAYYETHSLTYSWRINGKAILPILKAIQPYIKEKALRVKLAIELAGMIRSNRYQQIGGDEFKRRAEIVAEIKKYNRLGSAEDEATRDLDARASAGNAKLILKVPQRKRPSPPA